MVAYSRHCGYLSSLVSSDIPALFLSCLNRRLDVDVANMHILETSGVKKYHKLAEGIETVNWKE